MRKIIRKPKESISGKGSAMLSRNAFVFDVVSLFLFTIIGFSSLATTIFADSFAMSMVSLLVFFFAADRVAESLVNLTTGKANELD